MLVNNTNSHPVLRSIVRCQWRLAEEAVDNSPCSSTCCDRSQKVWSHLTGAAWTLLASCT